MRTIEKGQEPPSLRRHRKEGGDWETFQAPDERDQVRRALLDEQGHICCFCMRRIELRAMKVAHWAPQSDHPDQTLDWDNLLGACPGGDGRPRHEQHCDTAQGNEAITVHPANRTQRRERLLRYLRDGAITSKDPAIQKDVDVTLRLNHGPLRRARQQVMSVLLTRLQRAGGKTDYWPAELLERELAEWRRRDDQRQLREFCQVAIYVLEKQLDRRNV